MSDVAKKETKVRCFNECQCCGGRIEVGKNFCYDCEESRGKLQAQHDVQVLGPNGLNQQIERIMAQRDEARARLAEMTGPCGACNRAKAQIEALKKEYDRFDKDCREAYWQGRSAGEEAAHEEMT